VITCVVEYVIDPLKTEAFEEFARRWMELVGRHGGTHHGYFLPAEGASDKPWFRTATAVGGTAGDSTAYESANARRARAAGRRAGLGRPRRYRAR
jgi:hypothetical protein